MEQNFQTSFIPKRPVVPESSSRTHSVSLVSLIAILAFVTMLLATSGLFLYQKSLARGIGEMDANLIAAKNRFEPARLVELERLDRRLTAAREVLGKHISVSPIFQALGGITMKTVRYTRFEYSLGTVEKPEIHVKLSGMAVGYRAVALQSDLFAKNKNFIEPVFSNLNLDENGNVLFDLNFTVDPAFVNYGQMISPGNV